MWFLLLCVQTRFKLENPQYLTNDNSHAPPPKRMEW